MYRSVVLVVAVLLVIVLATSVAMAQSCFENHARIDTTTIKNGPPNVCYEELDPCYFWIKWTYTYTCEANTSQQETNCVYNDTAVVKKVQAYICLDGVDCWPNGPPVETTGLDWVTEDCYGW